MLPRVAITASLLALAARMAWFIDRFSVNLFVWDQWDFLHGFFDDTSLWTLFRWQHGPHRQGLASLWLKAVYSLFDYSSRAEAFSMLAVYVLTALIALALKRRWTGSLSPFDAVIPALFVSLTGYEALTIGPNPAHGPLPILLTIAGAYAFTLRERPWLRVALIALIAFVATYTGFAVFLPLVLGFVLAIEAVRERSVPAFVGTLACALSIGSFFVGYEFRPAIGCFHFPHRKPGEYYTFISVLFLRTLFDFSVNVPILVVGGVLLALLIAFFGYALWRGLREDKWRVIVLLSGYSFLFAANTAVGRVCAGGPSGALPSRYVLYAAPLLFAVYLAAQALPERFRTKALTVLTIAFFAKETLVFSAFKNAAEDSQGKRAWIACYASRRDPDACIKDTGFSVYPIPSATDLNRKLAWLRARSGSFFASVFEDRR